MTTEIQNKTIKNHADNSMKEIGTNFAFS